MTSGDRILILKLEQLLFIFASITIGYCGWDFSRTFSMQSLWTGMLLGLMMFWPPLRFRLLNGYWRD